MNESILRDRLDEAARERGVSVNQGNWRHLDGTLHTDYMESPIVPEGEPVDETAESAVYEVGDGLLLVKKNLGHLVFKGER